MLTSGIVKNLARACGFDLCGITTPEIILEAVARFDRWLSHGYQGEMQWLAETRDKRVDPSRLLTGVKSIIMLGMNYYQPNSQQLPAGHGRVARYARGKDYHKVVGRKIKHLIAKLQEQVPHTPAHDFYWWVDYGAFMEKAYAARAGLGFIGRNSLLISREYGSWIFLAEILTTVQLEPDQPPDIESDPCGDCTLCIDACPTNAITVERTVNATRCVSYLTIEQPGNIPEELAARMDGLIFGCDICQEVCPHNEATVVTSHREFLQESGVGESLDARRILNLQNDYEFLELTEGTSLTRPKLAGLQGNARIVLQNQNLKT